MARLTTDLVADRVWTGPANLLKCHSPIRQPPLRMTSESEWVASARSRSKRRASGFRLASCADRGVGRTLGGVLSIAQPAARLESASARIPARVHRHFQILCNR